MLGRQSLGIITICVLAAVVFGIAHDLITAHYCVEYFTVHHPHVVDSKSPLVMALVWGVLATWWMGAAAGVILWIANTAGPLPNLRWRDLRLAVMRALGAIWLTSMSLLVTCAYLVPQFWPRQKYHYITIEPIGATQAVHITSYFLSGTATIALAIWVIRRRYLSSQ